MNSAYVIASIVAAIAAVLAGGRWALSAVYKRGGTEREFKLALESNTEATKELTVVVKGVVKTLDDHDRRLDHAEWRLSNLEATPNVSVNVSPHRDPGLAGGH